MGFPLRKVSLLKKNAFLILPLILLNLGCSAKGPSEGSGLTLEEEQKLDDIVMEHEFYSGCVTEKIADIHWQLCEDQGICEVDISDTLEYGEWLSIYRACIANTL